MNASGFVLAGGASVRMGRDKASLPYRGATLLDHIAAAVREAAGNVIVIGGTNGVPDKVPGLGPIGGLFTALSETGTDWNLIVACDMPGISADALRILLKKSEISAAECVAAAIDGAPEPLCAVYHRRCLPKVTRALDDKRLKMLGLLAELQVETEPLDPAALANANTPAEWAAIESSR
jgi:molybdenum cofactor guanylyltransferase